MLDKLALFSIVLLAGCSTISKKNLVQVPVVVEAEGAWVQANGVRYAAPAVVPIDNSGAPVRLIVGSPAHKAKTVILRPVFQWKSLWLGPMGVIVDAASGAAWQQDRNMLVVDLDESSVRRVAPQFVSSTSYRDGTRLRGYGRASVAVGAAAAVAGGLLLFSTICYEDCAPGRDRLVSAAVVLQGAAVAAIVGGAIAWYNGETRREHARQRSLARGRVFR